MIQMLNFFWIFFVVNFNSFAFNVPEIKLEVSRTRGFKVSIPDDEGIRLFAFHAKINEEMNGREGGTFSRDITRPKNEKWTFCDPNAKLNLGDTIYYWTYVDYDNGVNKLGYVNDDKKVQVLEEHFVDNIECKKESNKTPFTFTVPEIKLEVLRPKGFKVSIPDVEGIKLFAFHAKLNEELNGREGGTFSRDIIKSVNGRWTFFEPYVRLKLGDVLYYWTYVDYFNGINKLGYVNDDKMIKVTEEHIVDKYEESTTIKITTTTEKTTTKNTTPDKTTSPSCKTSITKVKGRSKCKNKVIFNDEFNTFDRNKWKTEMRFAGEPDYEFVIYTNNTRVLQTTNGRLTITPTMSDEIFGEGFITSSDEYNFGEDCTAQPETIDCVQKAEAFLIKPPVASAQISTKDYFSFKYGTVEFKAKLPKGDWIYPELYLNPLNEEYGPFYESGQIRIAFCAGNSNMTDVLSGGCVLGNSNKGKNHFMKTIKKVSESWTDDFNVFSVTWTDAKITLDVNGNRYGTISAPEGGFYKLKNELDLKGTERWKRSNSIMAPFDQEMYITIGVGIGGHNFKDEDCKPWTNYDPKSQKNFFKQKDNWYPTWSKDSKLEVEYVKVFSI